MSPGFRRDRGMAGKRRTEGGNPVRKEISLFLSWLEAELGDRESRGLDSAPLRSYLRNLMTPRGSVHAAGAFGYSQRLGLMLDSLATPRGRMRILDAGCGYGTETLLFSLRGCETWGVELVPERAEFARSRIDFFQRAAGRPLDVRFLNANVLRFLEGSPSFDIIWAMESISHIHPVDEFFRLARLKLSEGGKLIITDPNPLNPLALARSIRIRGSLVPRPHRRFRDPETGEPADYGQERILPLFKLRRDLRKAGFSLTRSDMTGFMGSSLLPDALLGSPSAARFLIGFQTAMKRIPGLRSLGSIYTAVAVKDPEDVPQARKP